MKSIQEINMNANLRSLTADEALLVEGGSFWGDVAYVAGATLKSIWVFCKTAAEYQASLPPNLKK